jgi:hypothetical protein
MQPGMIVDIIRRYVGMLEEFLPGRLEAIEPGEEVDLADFAFDLIVRDILPLLTLPWLMVILT